MKKNSDINPDSPVPLYHQIAQAIRSRIERGDLTPGDHLQPLRDAADAWDVNFHTVRHAYAELARAGLVEIRGARGTRVISTISERATPRRDAVAIDEFVTTIVAQSETEFGMTPAELSVRIAKIGENRDTRVHVMECSQYQCEDLSQQLEEIWAVEALPFCLDRDGELPAGQVVATYFHYNEVRLRWPKRLASFSFLSIAPEQQLAGRLGRILKRTGKSMLTVCERDEPTAQAIIADVSAILSRDGFPIQSKILSNSNHLPEAADDELLLIPPRIWGDLSVEQRASGNLLEVRYTFDQKELDQLGAAHGWTRATRQHQPSATQQQ